MKKTIITYICLIGTSVMASLGLNACSGSDSNSDQIVLNGSYSGSYSTKTQDIPIKVTVQGFAVNITTTNGTSFISGEFISTDIADSTAHASDSSCFEGNQSNTKIDFIHCSWTKTSNKYQFNADVVTKIGTTTTKTAEISFSSAS